MSPVTRGAIGIDFGTTNTVVSLIGADGQAHLVAFPYVDGEIGRVPLGAQLPRAGRRSQWPCGRGGAVGYRGLCRRAARNPVHSIVQELRGQSALSGHPRPRPPLSVRRSSLGISVAAAGARRRRHGVSARDRDHRTAGQLRGRPARCHARPSRAIRRRSPAWGSPTSGTRMSRWRRRSSSPADCRARRRCWSAISAAAPATSRSSDSNGRTAGCGRRRSPTRGVGVAGDAFDYRIIDHLVSPELGRGSRYKAFDNILPIPQRYFTAFARWEQLALLRASRDMRDIRGLLRSSLDPEKIARLVEILDDNHGYRLYQARLSPEGSPVERHSRDLPVRGRLRPYRETGRPRRVRQLDRAGARRHR